MMTIDDEGEGDVWPNDDVITGIQFSGKFLGFHGVFYQNFPKIFKFRKNSQLNQIVSDLLQNIVLIDKPPRPQL